MEQSTQQGPRRLFFGFAHSDECLCVVAINGLGAVMLTTTLPMTSYADSTLESGRAAAIADMLTAFRDACAAQAVCGAACSPYVIRALARRLGGPVHVIDLGDIDDAALPGFKPGVAQPLRDLAHMRAILAAVAAADPTGTQLEVPL